VAASLASALSRAAIALLLLSPQFPAQAGGIELLTEFVRTHERGNVEFSQESFDETGELLAETEGELWFVRPDRFRLEYYGEAAQLVWGDGEKVWYYDPELEQATVRDFEGLGDSSALALLTGEEIQSEFILTSAPGKSPDYDWVHAVPVSDERTFEDIWIAFDPTEGTLSLMEIRDVFSNTMILRFSPVEREVSDGAFEIELPEGTAVFEEQG